MDSNGNVIIHEGRSRTFDFHIPPAIVAAKKPAPVVIGLHGGGGNAKIHNRQTRMDEAADRFGFIAVRPEGTGALPVSYTWNGGACCGYAVERNVDDVGFLSTLIDKLAARPEVDPKRIYLSGFSNGAMMALRVAAEKPARIAAVCAVGATAGIDLPDAHQVVPYLAIHGEEDKNAPPAGGIGTNAFSKIEHQPVLNVCVKWARGESPMAPDPKIFNDFITFNWYRETIVRLYYLFNGGHTWPGGVDVRNGQDGPLIATFDANAVMWEFFSRFTR